MIKSNQFYSELLSSRYEYPINLRTYIILSILRRRTKGNCSIFLAFFLSFFQRLFLSSPAVVLSAWPKPNSSTQSIFSELFSKKSLANSSIRSSAESGSSRTLGTACWEAVRVIISCLLHSVILRLLSPVVISTEKYKSQWKFDFSYQNSHCWHQSSSNLNQND